MEAGQRRHRIRLESPPAPGSVDSYGERVTVWTLVGTLWARVEPLSGRDQFLAAQRQQATSHKVSILYSTAVSGVVAGWRVNYNGRKLVVDNVINPGELNVDLELYCTEGLRNE